MYWWGSLFDKLTRISEEWKKDFTFIKKKKKEIEKRCFRDQSSSEVRKLSHMLAWLPGQSRRCTLNLLNESNLIFPRCYIWDIKSDPSDIPFHRKVVEAALRRHEALQHSISNIGFVL